MKSNVLGWFVTLPLIPIVLAGVISFFLAVGLLLYRAYYFLKFGHWLSSACDTAIAMTWQGANVPDACHEFSYTWVGVNYLLHSGLRNFDASAFAIILTGAIVLTALVWIFGAAAVVREFNKGSYRAAPRIDETT